MAAADKFNYTKLRDPASGIQPFVPGHKDASEEFSMTYLWINGVLGPILGAIKMVLLMPILVFWLAVASVLSACRVPWKVLRCLDFVMGRIVLHLLSFNYLSYERTSSSALSSTTSLLSSPSSPAVTSVSYVGGPKRMLLRATNPALAREYEGFTLHAEKPTSISARDTVKQGDWIISNHCSYVDLFYYWYLYSVTVLVIKVEASAARTDCSGHQDESEDEKRAVLCPCTNRFSALWWCLKGELEADVDTRPTDIQTALSPYPTVLFPEGTTSNGRGVLQFLTTDFQSIPLNRLHLTNLKYAAFHFNPAFPGSTSFLAHLWGLCSQLSNTLTARTILPVALSSSNFHLPPPSDPQLLNRVLQQIIAALGHMRPLKLSAWDKFKILFISNANNAGSRKHYE